jgi:RNA polymerase sigma factor (sigma-70 family)
VGLDPQHAADLIRRAAADDRSAWEELVDEYSGLIYTIARSHGLSVLDIAEVTQTTWLRLLEHIDRLTEPGRVAAWLVTTARRESQRTKERSSRMVLVGDMGQAPDAWEAGLGHAPCFEDEIDDRLLLEERNSLFRAAVEQLPADQQQFLQLLMHEPPLSYAEVSDILDIPIGSIGPTRMRCVAKLRRITDALSGHSGLVTSTVAS